MLWETSSPRCLLPVCTCHVFRPQDVLATLLNNLKVQERQNRVCTTVAIAIVAETCSPYTVLPALMNEYRVPELNVQNGVLKSLSFMFEYIGELGKDYIYAVTPLLEDALMDRLVCLSVYTVSVKVFLVMEILVLPEGGLKTWSTITLVKNRQTCRMNNKSRNLQLSHRRWQCNCRAPEPVSSR